MSVSSIISFGGSLFLSLCAINYSMMSNREGFLFSATLAPIMLIIGLMDISITKKEDTTIKNFKRSKSNQDLEIGKTYVLKKDKDNPFDEVVGAARIKDIQNGYVLYEINPGEGSIFRNESMKVDTFKFCYGEMK